MWLVWVISEDFFVNVVIFFIYILFDLFFLLFCIICWLWDLSLSVLLWEDWSLCLSICGDGFGVEWWKEVVGNWIFDFMEEWIMCGVWGMIVCLFFCWWCDGDGEMERWRYLGWCERIGIFVFVFFVFWIEWIVDEDGW